VASEQPGQGIRRDVVVIGASAGGIEALRRLIGALPHDLPAAVCVVLHMSASSPSALSGILARAGTLPSRQAQDGDQLVPGEILVAPPDHHLIVEQDHVRLTVGPRENNHRPSVDALFRSAAESAGERVTGVVLSGMRDDGSAGLAVIKANGGLALVQDPDEALHPGMPQSAIANVAVDAVLRCDDLAEAITDAAWGGPRRPATATSVPGAIPGSELTIVCPECGGVLSERMEAGVPRWACHVGHLYSPSSLNGAQGTEVERALWMAMRMLRDRAALLRRMAEHAQSRGQHRIERSFLDRATEADERANSVMVVLQDSTPSALGDVAEPAVDENDAA
jgi:two-component system, chemotaxis family, protein-glutamate methylesterase/glutaminase